MLLNPYRFGLPPSALLTGLVSYWKMDEASGNAIDSHGTNHLTDNNAVGSGAGIIGTARDFVLASNKHFKRISGDSLTSGDSDLTISFWCKQKVVGGASGLSLIAKYDSGTVREYEIYIASTNRMRWAVFGPSGNVTVSHADPLPINTWYHVVCSYNSVTDLLSLTVKGGAINRTNTSSWAGGFFVQPTANFSIGWSFNGAPQDGWIDEVGYWKRLLTPAELLELDNSGNGITYPFT